MTDPDKLNALCEQITDSQFAKAFHSKRDFFQFLLEFLEKALEK